MSKQSAPPASATLSVPRFSALVLGVFAAALAWECVAHSGQWGSLLKQFLPQAAAVICVLALTGLALLTGHALLRIPTLHPPEAAPRALALALGWGALSLYACLLAAVGTLTGFSLFLKITPLITILASLVLFRASLRELIADARALPGRAARAAAESLKNGGPSALAPAAFIAVVAALLLPRLLLSALTPSFQYDVLEYHLPAARQMLNTGSFAPVEGVRYTLMPQAVEALYAFGMLLEGTADGFAPKLLHLALALSAAFALLALLRELKVAAPLRYLAPLLFLLHPVSFFSLSDAFVEMGPALFVTAALAAWAAAARGGGAPCWRLAALFLGFALSCKYPVMGVAILPFLALPLPFAASGKTLPLLITTGVVITAAYLPWLARGFVFGHAPFPPLMPPWFGAADSAETALARCMADWHRPLSPLRAEWVEMVFQRVPAAGTLLALPALLLAALPGVERRVRALALFALAGYLVWCAAPNPEERFLSPLLPLLCGLAVLAAGAAGRVRPLCAGALALWATYLFVTQGIGACAQGFSRSGLGILSDSEFRAKLLGKPVVEFFESIEAAAEKQRRPRALLLFEARAALIPNHIPVEFNTVFDSGAFWRSLRDPRAGDPAWTLEQLKKRGVTLVAVNEAELARLLATYPAREALKDLEYQMVRQAQAPGMVYDPRFLPLKRFYPAIYYGGGPIVAARLDAFLNHLLATHPPVWQTNLGGARIFTCQI